MDFRDFRGRRSLCARTNESLGRAIDLSSLWDVFLINWRRTELSRPHFGSKSSISLKFHLNSTVGSYSKLHRDLGWILEICSLLSRAKNLFACQEAPNGLYISLGTPRGLPTSSQTDFTKSVSDSISDPRFSWKNRKSSKIIDFICISLIFRYFRGFSLCFFLTKGQKLSLRHDTFRKICLAWHRKTPRSAQKWHIIESIRSLLACE